MSECPRVPDDFQEDTAKCAGNRRIILKENEKKTHGRASENMHGIAWLKEASVWQSFHSAMSLPLQAVTSVADSCGKMQPGPHIRFNAGIGLSATSKLLVTSHARDILTGSYCHCWATGTSKHHSFDYDQGPGNRHCNLFQLGP